MLSRSNLRQYRMHKLCGIALSFQYSLYLCAGWVLFDKKIKKSYNIGDNVKAIHARQIARCCLKMGKICSL